MQVSIFQPDPILSLFPCRYYESWLTTVQRFYLVIKKFIYMVIYSLKILTILVLSYDMFQLFDHESWKVKSLLIPIHTLYIGPVSYYPVGSFWNLDTWALFSQIAYKNLLTIFFDPSSDQSGKPSRPCRATPRGRKKSIKFPARSGAWSARFATLVQIYNLIYIGIDALWLYFMKFQVSLRRSRRWSPHYPMVIGIVYTSSFKKQSSDNYYSFDDFAYVSNW